MFNPLFSANQWDWQSHCKLGQSILVVLCPGSMLLLAPVVRPAKTSSQQPSEVVSFSYWSIKLWFYNWGKTYHCAHHTLLLGFPTGRQHHAPGCREELLDPPDLGSMTTAACSMFHGKVIGPLGFSRRREFIGGRAMLEGGLGAHTTWWRGQGMARAALWCGFLLAALRLSFGLRLHVR
jgi:hypothetical protein